MRGADYVIKRTAFAIITIFVAITLNFFLFRVIPGDAVSNLARVPHEHELRCRIDIAEDEPGAGRPVDVAAPAGRPPHGTTSAARASSATAPTACSRAWIGK